LEEHVGKAIRADPALKDKALGEQFENLLLQPLRDVRKPLKIAIIVDALDECDQHEDARLVIELLSQIKSAPLVTVRTFLTSRPEVSIRLGFRNLTCKYEEIALHEISEHIIDHDLAVFYEHELLRIWNPYNKTCGGDCQLELGWPGKSKIQILVRMATPLFIFASTVCRFVNSKHSSPEQQLAKVLEYQHISRLEAVYPSVLNQLLVDVDACDQDDAVQGFRDVVGFIILLQDPLSAHSLSRLLGVPRCEVDNRLRQLHSVLSIPSNPDVPIRILHQSFRNFLLDSTRKANDQFSIDAVEGHRRIARRCLHILNPTLKHDICCLRTPGKGLDEVNRESMDESPPSHCRYACQYWIHHFKQGKGRMLEGGNVHTFLKHHYLHWLEGMSLSGRTEQILSTIDILESVVDVSIAATNEENWRKLTFQN
jgi:hypothetical protein